MPKGKLITIYGINNIGKSTHCRRLVKNLKNAGKKALFIKYPAYSVEPSGSFLNRIIRTRGQQRIPEEELQLWFLLNRYQFQPKLKKMLEEGYYVVAEDYSGTGIAWGHTKGGDLKWLEEVNKYLIKENLAILIEGERSRRAEEEVHIHEKNPALMKKSRGVFLKLGKKYGWKQVELQVKKADTEKLIWATVKRSLKI